MIFKIYNCDFGIKVNGVAYDFTNVAELQIEDNEKNRLTRGANAQDEVGLVYKEGMKEAKKWTLPILAMTPDLKTLLDSCFDNQSRVDVYCVDRTDGSAKMAKQSVLCNRPQQLKLDDSPDSMNVQLEFETFNSNENHKS